MQKKKAISLMVLIITIVIMIILAGVVIINLRASGLIDRAKQATDNANLMQVQYAANMLWLEGWTSGVKKTEALEQYIKNGLTEQHGVNLSKYKIIVNVEGVAVALITSEEQPEVEHPESDQPEEPEIEIPEVEKKQLETPVVEISNHILQITLNDPQTQYCKMYVDGEFKAEISNQLNSFDLSSLDLEEKTYLVYVKAFAEGYIESQESNKVEYVVKNEIPGILINIDMNNNGVNAAGNSAYNATIKNGGTYKNGKFVSNGGGALTVPTGFMAGTSQWTIAFAIDSYKLDASRTFCRIARGNNDVPSIFYQTSAKGFMIKLASATLFAGGTAWYDTSFLAPWGGDDTALIFNFPSNEKTIFAFRNDGTHISMWVNGEIKIKQLTRNYVSKYYASTFSIGDDANVGYKMANLECSMLKAWDRALTENEMTKIK